MDALGMHDRTRRYLAGRFADYYRQATIGLPPGAQHREWGYIPFTSGPTRMVRHRAILDIGDLGRFLAETAPQHVYFSAARYREPGADEMGQKGWQGADLIFDIDADHLPGIDPAETSASAMLEAAKDAVRNLLVFIDETFGFEQTQVVFSGGRGYHVHVRDAAVQSFDSTARRELVDYVRAVGIGVDELTETRSNQGTTQRVLRHRGGWGAALHDRLQAFATALREQDRPAALARLEAFDQIGETRAERVYDQVVQNPTAIASGNLEAGGPGMRIVAEHLLTELRGATTAPVDEPVTTDVRRLIRLPESLHGGTALRVVPLTRDEIAGFDPFDDAVVDRFVGQQIAVRLTDAVSGRFMGDTFTLTPGEHRVDEALGMFLMARGAAEKLPE
jgi:DNA primase small subunit